MTKTRRAKRRQSAKQPLRLIGYVRVSTTEQARDGLSVEVQRDRLKAYVKAMGYKLIRIESDNGTSGKVKPEKRDGLGRVLEAIDTGEADGVVFVKLDRLSRRVRDILRLADQAKRKGWHMVSVSEQLDTSTAMGRFVLTMFAALAEMEADRLSERTTEAMNGKELKGRARSSKLPFGFRVKGAMKATTLTPGDKRPLVKHKDEQLLLQRIIRLDAKGLGTYAIMSSLNDNGSTNPRTGKPWGRSSIRAIVATANRRAERRASA